MKLASDNSLRTCFRDLMFCWQYPTYFDSLDHQRGGCVVFFKYIIEVRAYGTDSIERMSIQTVYKRQLFEPMLQRAYVLLTIPHLSSLPGPPGCQTCCSPLYLYLGGWTFLYVSKSPPPGLFVTPKKSEIISRGGGTFRRPYFFGTFFGTFMVSKTTVNNCKF